MAEKKISQLATAGALVGLEVMALVQAGATKKVSLDVLRQNITPDVFYAGTTDASIRAAKDKAVAAGCGVVKIPSLDIDLESPLPMISGIWYEGSGWTCEHYFSNAIAGTILRGDGTFNIFEGNAVDRGSNYGNSSDLMAAVPAYNGGIRDLIVANGLYGIKSGALHEPGPQQYHVDNVLAFECEEWGFWFENYSQCVFDRLQSVQKTTSRGHLAMLASVPTSLWTFGNSTYGSIFTEGGGPTTRNTMFMARGGGVAMNDINVFRLQSNASGEKITRSASFVTGNADITVPDASEFPVDMPVTFDSYDSGFYLRLTYFVVSSDTGTNKIRISDTMGGTAKLGEATATANIIRYGYPSIEIVGYGADNSIQPSTFYGIDAEGVATTSIFVQNASLVIDIGSASYDQDGSVNVNLCCRNAKGSWRSSGPIIPEFDLASATVFVSNGAILKDDAFIPESGSRGRYLPQGTFQMFSTGVFGLQLGYSWGAQGARQIGLYAITAPGQSFHYPGNAMGQRVRTWDTATLTIQGGEWAGSMSYVGVVDSVVTLPTLTGAANGAPNTSFGIPYHITNASKTGGVDVTVNTASGQPFNRQDGDESCNIPLGKSVSIRAVCVADGDYFWSVEANNGATIS